MAEYMEIATKALDDIETLLKSEGFTLVVEREGTQLFEKPLEGSSVSCFKATRLIDASPQKGTDGIWSWQLAEWLAVSPDLKSWEIGETIDDNTRIVYQVNSLPWPLWARDTLVVGHKGEKNGVHYLVFKSVQHPNFPEKPKEYVRANVLHSAFVFQPEGEKTRITRIVQVEPAGVIPSSVVNSLSRGMLDTLDKLNTLLH